MTINLPNFGLDISPQPIVGKFVQIWTRDFIWQVFSKSFFVRELNKHGSCEINFGAQPPSLPPTRGNSLRHFHFRLLIAVYRWQVRGNMGLPLHFAASLQEFFARKLKQTVEECRSGQSGVWRIGNENMGNGVWGRGGSSRGIPGSWFWNYAGVTSNSTAARISGAGIRSDRCSGIAQR